MGRNLLDYYPSKGKLINVELRSPLSNGQRPNSFRPLKVNLPTVPTDSPGLKGATSISSLPTSTAEDTPKYFWDSFDLNNPEGTDDVPKDKMTSEIAANDSASFVSGESSNNERTRLLAPAAIDPTRDIETLPEDVMIATMPRRMHRGHDTVSNADTEDEPQMGQVFARNPVSTSFEQLLALNDDIHFADDDDMIASPVNAEQPNSYDYHLHLNNYLPTYNLSEYSETDEQTPMLDRRRLIMSPNSNRSIHDYDISSDYNASIRALPEDKFLKPQPPLTSSSIKSNLVKTSNNGDTNGTLDNLCELEETDDEEEAATPTVENKSLGLSRITQV